MTITLRAQRSAFSHPNINNNRTIAFGEKLITTPLDVEQHMQFIMQENNYYSSPEIP